jgi:hypothetical protein
MSLKFAAIGNLMALSAFENHALVRDRFGTKALGPVEAYDPLLAMIGQGRRVQPIKPEQPEQLAEHPRW